jgi:hypothetical protein
VADSVFGKNSGLDTVKLVFDYLPALVDPGAANILVLNIYGDYIDQDVLLWTGQTTINTIASSDQGESLSLAWVGPQIGDANIIIVIGKIGTVTVTGEVQPRPGS